MDDKEKDTIKMINIVGKTNYKLIQGSHKKDIMRVCTETKKWIHNITENELVYEKQWEYLLALVHLCNQTETETETIEEFSDTLKIMKSHIERKIYGYKIQDIEKKMYDSSMFIHYTFIIQKLMDCQLNCFYCKRKMSILYKKVRDASQWTVDRINNEKGHNINNIELSCLACNLKKRKRNSDHFLFTQQLVIIKNEQ